MDLKKKKKETTLLTIICLVRRVLQILYSWISDQFQLFLFFFDMNREERTGSLHKKDMGIPIRN